LGAEIDLEIQAPVVHRDTLETSIPGLFCAGVLLAGDIAGQIFIENSREHGQRILPRLLEICQQ
jgi:thioredoxin reductase (NADPH)